jgi:uncharacterized protein YfaS (alpha-2-macroglobulin family)
LRRTFVPAVWIIAGALAACSGAQKPGAPLAPVSALSPPALPAWIASISPTKPAESLAQIRVIFVKPVTTVGALEGDGPRDVIAHFQIEPQLAGKFVVLTPRMVGFVPEQALPVATRVRVTLTAGLRDVAGDALAQDLAWTFNTDELAIAGLPSLEANPDTSETPAPSDVSPKIAITSNAEVDPASLAAHAVFNGGGETVDVDAKLEAQPTPYPGSGAQEAFDPSLRDWIYDVTPKQDLKKGTVYTLAIAPGVIAAHGNMPSAREFSGKIRTYQALAIAPTPRPSPGSAVSGRFASGDPAITFNNNLDPKSIAGAVALEPAPKSAVSPAPPIGTVSDYSPNAIALDSYLLSPDTVYTATIGSNVKDIFGQTLGTPQRVTFRTGDFTPGFWTPTGVNVFPSDAGVAMNYYAINVRGGAYRSIFKPVTPAMLAKSDDAYTLLPEAGTWPKRSIASAATNKEVKIATPLQSLLGGNTGALAYGASADLGDPDPKVSNGLVQLTDLGIIGQLFPNHTLATVQRLSNGAPVAGAAVTLYRTGDNASTTPCAHGTTDANGQADIGGTAIASCYAGSRDPDVAPGVMFVASLGKDWSYVRVDPWDGIFRFNVDGTWTNGQPLSRGTIFSDRQMYQPGESAKLTGIAYYVRDGRIVADKNAAYAVSMVDPSGNKKSLGSVRTDAYGAFQLAQTFGPNQPLGYYSIIAKGSSGNEIDGQLRVAEFKPPNFKLDLTFDKTTALAGSNVTANAKAAYLFGAPLDGGKAKITVTRAPANLAPTGWDDYTFGPQWFWPENQPSIDTDVLQSSGTFDKDGAYSRSIPVAAVLPFPLTYSVDVQASDVSNLIVDNTQTFTALANDGVVGLQSGLVSTAGQAMPVNVIVTDLNGKTLAGRSVHLELQKMTYAAATQLVEGGENAQYAVSYATVDTADVTPGTSPAIAQLHPKDPGPYRIRANFGGATGAASESDLQAFVVGAGDVNWGGQSNTDVQIKLDKRNYKIGDTATALVASPFGQSDIYFAVVRHDVLMKKLVHATGNGPKISFTVTRDMLPNAAVEAFVIRRGSPLHQIKPGSLTTLSRVGVAPLSVDLGDRYLKVKVTPQHATIEPGSNQSVAVAVRNANGRPSAAEVVIMVVNESILQLTGYRPPDLVQTVFAAQPISTRFGDNREHVVLQTLSAAAEKGWGYGGGFLAGAGSTRVRTNFQPLAYYQVVRTDANGNASVHFTLPDDLTTWRAMAVALGADTMHFGNADATFVATKALQTNPLLPQFGRPGDTMDAGVSVLHQAGGGSLALSAALTGALTFASGDPTSFKESSDIGSGMQALRFPMVVGTPAPTTVSFSSALGGANDAFRVPFDVRDRSVSESTIEAGASAQNASVPIDFSQTGSVQITLANSVVPQFAVPSAAAMNADPEPFLDDAASRLIVASATATLAPRYHLKPGFDAHAAIVQSLAAIAKLRFADGGFKAFPQAEDSDPWGTAFTAGALAFARSNGATVDASELAAVKAYLARSLADPAKFNWCATAQCRARLRFEMLWALDALGDHRSDFLSDIVAQTNSFDPATQIRLARYLLRTPGWQSHGNDLADRLTQSVYVTGRYSNVSPQDRWGWLGSTVDAQAQMLQLLVQRNAPAEQTDGAVRALAAQQCGCGWPTIDDTASAMQALTAYASREKLAPFTATATSAGATLAHASFGTTAESKTVTVDASSVRGKTLDLAVQGGGMLHYVVLYTYAVAKDAPGQLAGLRVIRDVRPAGEANALATMDLAALPDPIAAVTGSVYDVGVRVIADHPIDNVVIEDPIPAGMQAIDATFQTASTATVARSDSWAIDDQQIYADRVMAFASHLEPGIYEVHYLVNTVTPGEYRWPGARAYLRNAPEQFGRTAAAVLKVQ